MTKQREMVKFDDELRAIFVAYGALKEGIHAAGYTLERAFSNLKWMLTDRRWMKVGYAENEIGLFLQSINLDQFRIIAQERKQIAALIKKLEPKASNRAIAKAVGVNRRTVDRDGGANAPPEAEKTQGKQQMGGANAPHAELSGSQAHQAAERAEQAAERKERKEEKKRSLVAAGTFSETGPFGTIVIDPPWEMEKIDRAVRPNQDVFDYPTMSIEQLLEFWIKDLGPRLESDCHTFMWTTEKWLPEAIRFVGLVGFKYVLTMVWHKPGGFQPVGLPQYNCEFVVYARRGAAVFVDTKNFNCCFDGERREHSRKPDNFYDVIRRVTGGSRIDVFSREKREGFATFGNESNKFTEAAE